MNPVRQQKALIAGALIVLAAIPFARRETHSERSARHVAEAMAENEAIRDIQGTPNAVANYDPLLFKTDKDGVLYALYADGWKKVRP
jgi:hypothetical protein